MSKTISYKGKINIGEQQQIRLKTNNGKTGYRITKFQVMSTTPGVGDVEMIGQIFNKDQTGSISATVDFSDSNLMAVSYYREDPNNNSGIFQNFVIFDNTKTNQDIFITMTDAMGATVPGNYYIELEAMTLSDLETTMLTLQSLRTLSS